MNLSFSTEASIKGVFVRLLGLFFKMVKISVIDSFFNGWESYTSASANLKSILIIIKNHY